jgi:hypothetical protein
MAKEGQGRYDFPRVDLGIHDRPQRERAIALDLSDKRIGDGRQSRPQRAIPQKRRGFILVLDGKLA